MPLRPCPSCACHVATDACTCPHCGASVCARDRALPRAALLMGLVALVGCYPVLEVQPMYGVAVDTHDDDLDGYSEADADCDDEDPDVNPEAEETPGDGVDSNCDGEDDS